LFFATVSVHAGCGKKTERKNLSRSEVDGINGVTVAGAMVVAGMQNIPETGKTK
jgi:hypothetical protein